MKRLFLKIIKDPIYRSSLISLVVFIVVVSLCIYYYNFIGVDTSRYESIPLEGKGQIGDSWGMFTSVFSALAFWGLLTTLIFQATSISQAKVEANEQNRKYNKQQVEEFFFRMFNIHNDLVNNISLRLSTNLSVLASGRDVFFHLHKELSSYYSKGLQLSKIYNAEINNDETESFKNFSKFNKSYISNKNSNEVMNVIGFSYEGFWGEFRSDLGHYFRFLFNLFKYIDSSNLDDDEKLKYAKLVRAQLSDYEVIIIFYNCLTWRGIGKFKPLIEKYMVFDNIPFELLLDLNHQELYDISAFDGKKGEADKMYVLN